MIKSQKLANVESWEINLIKNEVIWSKSLREIMGSPLNFSPSLSDTVNLFEQA
jgi:hypothetical protein